MWLPPTGVANPQYVQLGHSYQIDVRCPFSSGGTTKTASIKILINN